MVFKALIYIQQTFLQQWYILICPETFKCIKNLSDLTFKFTRDLKPRKKIEITLIFPE